MKEPSSTVLLSRFRNGNEAAATQLFDRYIAALTKFAHHRMSRRLARRIDPEDIALSAFRSFFRRNNDRTIEVPRTGSVWETLVGFARQKLRSQIERNTANKRTIHREVGASSFLARAIASGSPSPSETLIAEEQFQSIRNGLRGDECAALSGLLAGMSAPSIARKLNKSARTIRRLLQRVRQAFEQMNGIRTNRSCGDGHEGAAPNTLAHEDFRLNRLLGSGGMGKVYLAFHRRTNKHVAVKALRKSWVRDARAVQQFLHEAEILTKLRHSNIVNVIGLGKFPHGGYFLAMEHVDGSDLQTRLKETPFSREEVVRIVCGICEGIAYAHSLGIIHCDLKPANVLVDRSGRVVVTDFGFAQRMMGHRVGGNVGGTPGYMAPELSHARTTPTPAVDIYSIGVVLWTLMTRSLPLNDAGDMIHDSRVFEFRPVLARCLALDPNDRYSSAKELLTSVRSVLIASAEDRR